MIAAPDAAELAVRRMARALGNNGLSGPFGHCSVRLDPERFLVCAARPMALVGVGEKGTVVHVTGALPNGVLGEVRMHQQIYQRRPEAGAICRFISPHVTALAAMGRTPRARHGFGCYFPSGVPMWLGLPLIRDDATAAQAADLMGEHPALFLNVNGAVTVAETPERAVALAYFLEDAARVELAVLAAGTQAAAAPVIEAGAAAERATWSGRIAERVWEYLLRSDPEPQPPRFPLCSLSQQTTETMMKQTISLRLLTTLAAGALLGGAAQAQEVTLKIHHFLPATAPIQVKVLEPWCQKITQASANRIKCNIFPAMQLGGTAPQLYDQVKDGVVDIIWTIPGYTPGRFLVTEIFELPFMMSTPEATSRALWEFQARFNAAEFREVKPLAFHMNGPGNFYTKTKPIQRLADFKGLKMRGATRQTTRMLAALGATPVGMPLPAVTDALSKGVIDGALTPYEVVQATKMHELTRFTTESDPSFNAVYAQAFVLAMNQAKYASLPDDLKKVIDDNTGADFSAWVGKMIHEADVPGRKLVEQAGNPIHTLPVAELQAWKKATAQLDSALVGEIDKRGLDGAALLKAARELIEKSKNP